MADRIPLSRAKEIARHHGYHQVIVYARRVGLGGVEWVTTYGIDKLHCAAAARIGKALGEHVIKPIEDLTARAEAAERRVALLEADLAELRKDKDRLDWLDACNARLNARYGTNYGWSVILSHNVTRLMLGHMVVDLHDSEGGVAKLPSCRAAIDERRRRLSEGRFDA